MPEADHPSYGVVRAIVKDNDDQDTGSGAEVYLDSGGSGRVLIWYWVGIDWYCPVL